MKGTRWTPRQHKTLRELWSNGESCASIAKTLGRTPCAVYQQAHAAGLTSRPPLGWEHITQASERVGIHWNTLAAILKKAGVKTRRAQVAPWLKRRPHLQKIVRRAAVTRAVQAHLQLESVTSAAKRSGVRVCYLLVRLHALGIRARKPRAKLLINEAQLAAALAIPRRPGRSVMEAIRA